MLPLSDVNVERESSFTIAVLGDHPMTIIQVFDPAMCCSTGVCGPNVNSALPRFAADLEWLKEQGVEIHRHNLAQEPRAFAENDVVKNALRKDGDKCLPLILVDGDLVAQGIYPSREELAVLVGLPSGPGSSLYSSAVEELVAIGAAIGAGCEPCFTHHFREARKAGVGRAEIASAVATARKVKEAAAGEILKLAGRFLAAEREEATLKTVPCCGPGTGKLPEQCC
jgi:AhpD family alkylhydroperoxidase